MGLYANISTQAPSKTWSKAHAIAFKETNFHNKREGHMNNRTLISAEVVSSDGWPSCYETSIFIEDETGEIISHSCDCPAHLNYSGPCKHCYALCISYALNPSSFEGNEFATKSTSAHLATLLDSEASIIEECSTQSKIHLTPLINFDTKKGWLVKFKITDGGEKEYSINSIGEFINRVEKLEFYQYGKYLSFTHDIRAFDVESQKVVNFLMDVFNNRYEAYELISSSYYYYKPFKIPREITLGSREMVGLFDALKNYKFDIKTNGTQWKRNQNLQIKHDNPPLTVEISEVEDGFTISINKKYVMVKSEQEMYVWVDGEGVYKCRENFSSIYKFLCSYLHDTRDEDQFITKEDMPLFCETILPKLESNLTVLAPEETKRLKPQQAEFQFFLDVRRSNVILDAVATYDAQSFPLWGNVPKGLNSEDSEEAEVSRDRKREMRVITMIKDFFSHDDEYLSTKTNIEAVGNFLDQGLPRFNEVGKVFATPAFNKLIGVRKPSVSVEASIFKNALKLDISSSQLTNEEIAELLKSYRQKQKYHLLPSGALVNVDELEFDELDEIADDLELNQNDIKQGSVELPTYRAFYLDSQKSIASGKGFKEYVENLQSAEKKKVQVPKQVNGILRPYQKEGYRWLRSRTEAGFGGILADEMGLGKSIQFISLLLSQQKQATAPSLIICPSSLVYNWKAEFDRFAPELNVMPVSGSALIREESVKQAFSSWEMEEEYHVDVLITSYDLARIDSKTYTKYNFNFLALDEAQYIKNTKTQTTKAVKSISALHRFALTGTPIENRLSELWSIFDFLMPGILGNKTRFKTKFEKPIAQGDESASDKLQKHVGPFMLRRCKKDVLKDLPDKLESVVYSEMGNKQKELYFALEQRLATQLKASKDKNIESVSQVNSNELSQIEVLAELTKMRQVCCDPRLLFENFKEEGSKLQTILELIDSAIDGEEKVLLFSQFTSFLGLIAEKLKEQKIKYYTITGSTPKKKRLDLVNAFNADDVPVFLISLKAGGTGLNLTGASVVIHADPWWNDAAQQQATDRAHRIGQTRVVNVQKVIAKDTIEERIVKLQEKKRELSEQFVKEGSVSLSSLSEQDLFELLNGED